MSNSIELIKKLAKLAKLVENWENPTAEFIEDISTINHEPPDCWSFGNGWFSATPRCVFKEEAIQKAFQAEVCKVAEELEKEINYKGNRPAQTDIDRYNFNTLFFILMELLAKIDDPEYWDGDSPVDAHFALYAICHKMDVEREASDV